MNSILPHPIFWDYQKGFDFIKAVSMDLDKTNEESSGQLRSKADQKFSKIWGSESWESRLCANVKRFKASMESGQNSQTKHPKKYNANHCTALIDFISDKGRHYGTWKRIRSLTSASTFAYNGRNYAEYFITRFPELIPTLFVLLQKKENVKYRSKELNPFFINVDDDSFTGDTKN